MVLATALKFETCKQHQGQGLEILLLATQPRARKFVTLQISALASLRFVDGRFKDFWS